MNTLQDKQQGTTLVVALIFLLILTILGVTSVSNSILQQKMAGNLRDQSVAFEAAESAVRAGESWVNIQQAKPASMVSYPGLNGVWKTGILGNLTNKDYAWWTATSPQYSLPYDAADSGNSAFTIAQTYVEPRYVIEEVTFIPDGVDLNNPYGAQSGRHYYRITGYGIGATQTAQAVTQSTFVKRFNFK